VYRLASRALLRSLPKLFVFYQLFVFSSFELLLYLQWQYALRPVHSLVYTSSSEDLFRPHAVELTATWNSHFRNCLTAILYDCRISIVNIWHVADCKLVCQQDCEDMHFSLKKNN